MNTKQYIGEWTFLETDNPEFSFHVGVARHMSRTFIDGDTFSYYYFNIDKKYKYKQIDINFSKKTYHIYTDKKYVSYPECLRFGKVGNYGSLSSLNTLAQYDRTIRLPLGQHYCLTELNQGTKRCILFIEASLDESGFRLPTITSRKYDCEYQPHDEILIDGKIKGCRINGVFIHDVDVCYYNSNKRFLTTKRASG